MIYLGLLTVLLVPLALGLGALSFLLGNDRGKFTAPEKLALSFLLGLGFLTLLMFLAGMSGLKLTFLTVAAPALLVTAGLITYALKSGRFCLDRPEFKLPNEPYQPIEWLLLGLLALKTLYVYFTALIKPLVDVDAFQQYSIVAKAIFFDGSFTLPYLYQFYGDKPLLPFLAQGWAFLGMGAANDALFKVLFPTVFLALLVIFYAVVRRSAGRTMSLLFTFLLSTLPLLVYHTTTAYADVTITAYYAAATFYLYLFMKERAKSSAAVGFTLLGFAVWAKKAGLILAGVNILFLVIFLLADKERQLWRKAVIPFVIFLIIISPWLALGRLGTFETVIRSFIGAKTAPLAAAAVAQPAPEESKLPVIAAIFGRKLFLYGDWHLTWGLFVLSLVFFYKRAFRPPLVYLLAIILLDFSSLFVQFGSGETFRWLLDGTLFDRLVMNEVPVVLYFAALAIIPGWTERLPADAGRAPAKKRTSS